MPLNSLINILPHPLLFFRIPYHRTFSASHSLELKLCRCSKYTKTSVLCILNWAIIWLKHFFVNFLFTCMPFTLTHYVPFFFFYTRYSACFLEALPIFTCGNKWIFGNFGIWSSINSVNCNNSIQCWSYRGYVSVINIMLIWCSFMDCVC